jgi:hypothetical protein
MSTKKERLLFEGLFTGFRAWFWACFRFRLLRLRNGFHWLAATNYLAWFTFAPAAWGFNRDNQPTFITLVSVAFFTCQKLTPALKYRYIIL